LQAANQFYQPLFSNSPSAILFPSAILPPTISLQSKNPPSKILPHPKASCPLSESLLYPVVNKEWSTAVQEGHDIVARGTCFAASLNINNLGKAAELHVTFSLSSAVEAVPNLSLQII
jgi:hypothetical protein